MFNERCECKSTVPGFREEQMRGKNKGFILNVKKRVNRKRKKAWTHEKRINWENGLEGKTKGGRPFTSTKQKAL